MAKYSQKNALFDLKIVIFKKNRFLPEFRAENGKNA